MLSKELGSDENHSYENASIELLDYQVKRLKDKEVSTVKVLWRNHLFEGETWEDEAAMRDPFTLTCSVLEVRYTLPKSCFYLRNSGLLVK